MASAACAGEKAAGAGLGKATEKTMDFVTSQPRGHLQKDQQPDKEVMAADDVALKDGSNNKDPRVEAVVPGLKRTPQSRGQL